MNQQLYNILVSQLSDKPNLADIQERHPLAETWPVILKEIKTFRNQMQHFVIDDGQSQCICTTTLPDVETKVKQMELGSIIHIVGADIRFSEANKQYIADVQEVCTLKQYDDRMKQQEEAKRQRMEWLKQQQEEDAQIADQALEEATSEKKPEPALV